MIDQTTFKDSQDWTYLSITTTLSNLESILLFMRMPRRKIKRNKKHFIR
jgi:hypothetical protein